MAGSAAPRFHLPPDANVSYLPMRDGARIRAFFQPHPAPTGRLLVLTGRADFLEKWAEPFRLLGALGVSVASFDWRGQGLSARTESEAGHISSFEQWLADLDEILPWATDRFGAPPDFVLGHSMGGHLLLRWLTDQRHEGARLAPELRGAVFVAPLVALALPLPLVLAAGALAPLALRIGKGARYAFGQGPYRRDQWSALRQSSLTSSVSLYEDEQRWVAANPALATGGVTWSWLNAFRRSRARLARTARGAFPVRSLMLVGDRERVVSRPAILRFVAKHPNMDCETIAGGAHELLREAPAIRQGVLQRIARFLAG